MTLGEASPPRSATRNVTTTLRRMAVGAAGTTCARLESFWLQTSGFLLFLPSPGRSFLTHSCYLTAAKAFMVTSYGLCAWETRGKQRKQPRGISPKARWALTWEPANRNNGEPHKLPAAHLPPGQDKALAGAPRSRVAASSSWDRHGVFISVLFREDSHCNASPVTQQFYNKPTQFVSQTAWLWQWFSLSWCRLHKCWRRFLASYKRSPV